MDQHDNFDYIDHVVEEVEHESQCFKNVGCVSVLVVYVLTCLLGLCGNALVIWISGFKMKKTVNTTWFLSLAISDFIFCVFVTFDVTHVVQHWIFGRFMCKLTYMAIGISMYSSVFLLVIISVDRCVSVMFPVWSQNHRTVRNATIVVGIVWLLAIAPSCPVAIYWDVFDGFCYSDVSMLYPIIIMMEFIPGFIIPLIIIIICCSVIIFKHCTSRTKFSKSFKVMIALVAVFFLCLLPYHMFILLHLTNQLHYDTFHIGLMVVDFIAVAHSFLNPVLYVFMGNDVKQTFKTYVLSKMENAMAEEGHTSIRYLPRSNSMDEDRLYTNLELSN